jgi:hypothetical protein
MVALSMTKYPAEESESLGYFFLILYARHLSSLILEVRGEKRQVRRCGG